MRGSCTESVLAGRSPKAHRRSGAVGRAVAATSGVAASATQACRTRVSMTAAPAMMGCTGAVVPHAVVAVKSYQALRGHSPGLHTTTAARINSVPSRHRVRRMGGSGGLLNVETGYAARRRIP